MSRVLFGKLAVSLTALLLIDGVKPECIYREQAPPLGKLGAILELNCAIEGCYSEYTWNEVSSMNRTRLEVHGDVLAINITSVDEYGGKLYECYCKAVSEICLKFKIAVKPITNLVISNQVIKTGTEVFINCTATGYPTNFTFTLEHGALCLNTEPLLTEPSGVYYKIDSANKSDDGEYACLAHAIFAEYNNYEIQGDRKIKSLTVYDPPYISYTYNDTVFDEGQNQTAVLKCAVDRVEPWINVSINWTTADEGPIEELHTETKPRENESYLILDQVARDRVYSCNVYSAFGLEDSALLTVVFADTVFCDSNFTCSDPKNSTDEQNDDLTDCWQCFQVKVLIGVALALFLLLVIWTILTFLFGEKISKWMKEHLASIEECCKNVFKSVLQGCKLLIGS